MIGQFFTSLTNKIFTGLIVALLIFGGVQSWRLGNAKGALDDTRTALALETARHSITRQSVDTLEAKLSDMIKAGELTQANVERSIADAKKETDKIRNDAKAVGSLVGENCVTPAEIMELDL